jgi:hypothetical protein
VPQVAADHHSDDRVRIDLSGHASPNDLPVAQDRDPIGNTQYFLNTVGDVEDADAFGLEPANLREQKLHLALGQRRRRFIESQDPAPA